MMQIGVQPLSAALVGGRPYDPDQAPGGHRGAESRPAGEAPEDAGDGILFVSPPPMPFPRVFPGL
jgi:hypothetical protein